MNKQAHADFDGFVNPENFFLLINATRNLVTLKDGENRWRIANTSTLDLYGLNAKAWQAKTCEELAALFDESGRGIFDACAQADRKAWETGRPVAFVWTVAAGQNQKPRSFEMLKTPLFEADGSRKALVCIG